MQRFTRIAVPAALALLAGASSTNAQVFHRAIGFTSAEAAYSVESCTPASGGGFITVGRISQTPTTPRDMYIVRYDGAGNDLWTRVISSPGGADEVATSVRQTADGGFIIAAESLAVSPTMGIALVRLGPAGNFMWGRAYAGTPFEDFPSGAKVRELSDGTFTVIGRARAGILSQGRMIHVGPGGNVLWANTYSFAGGPPAEISFTDVRFVPPSSSSNGGYFVSGWYREETSSLRSALIMQMSPAGNPLNAWTYSLPGQSITADGLTVSGSNLIFSGRIAPSASAAPTRTVIARVTQAAGLVSWARSESDFVNGFAALSTDINSVIVAGTNPSDGGLGLVKLNNAGGFIFANSHDVRGEGHDVITTPGLGQGYVTTGFDTQPPVNGQQDVPLIKTDVWGNSSCRVETRNPPTAVTLLRTPRSVVFNPNLQNITLPIVIDNPNSGNIIKCFRPAADVPAACSGDWNHDQIVTSQDFFEFIQAFFSDDADFDGNDETTSQDFFEFLRAFFTPC